VTGRVVGWEPPGTAEVQDHIRELLQRQVDPVPPFAARAWPHPEGAIAVVRVHESVDTPHVVRRTGGVYVRGQGGKLPADHSMVLALAAKKQTARERATDRLFSLSPPPTGSQVTPSRLAFTHNPKELMYRLAVTPLTLSGDFHDRALRKSTIDLMHGVLYGLRPVPPERVAPQPLTTQYGLTLSHSLFTGSHGLPEVQTVCTVALDGRGLVEVSLRVFRDPIELAQMDVDVQVPQFLHPLLAAAATMLEGLEAVGTALFYLQIHAPPDATLFMGATAAPLQRSNPATPGRVTIDVVGELLTPADDDVIDDAAEASLRQVMRAAGVAAYEPEVEPEATP
jgi:hypothetical protein